MSWTKQDYVLSAFDETGIGSYQFDIQPEMLDVGRRKLETMLSQWSGIGIRIGGSDASSPQAGNLDDVVGAPDYAHNAIILNLGIALSSVFGKQLSPQYMKRAKEAYDAMLVKNITVPEMQLANTIPAGQGNKLRRTYSPYLPRQEDSISDKDGQIQLY